MHVSTDRSPRHSSEGMWERRALCAAGLSPEPEPSPVLVRCWGQAPMGLPWLCRDATRTARTGAQLQVTWVKQW